MSGDRSPGGSRRRAAAGSGGTRPRPQPGSAAAARGDAGRRGAAPGTTARTGAAGPDESPSQSRSEGWSRAQSSVIGFVFVFSLITLTVGTTLVFGLSTLGDAQDVERLNNMERAFDVLHDNVDGIAREDDPRRATEIRLSGGTLAVDDRTSLEVTVENASDPAENATIGASNPPIVYGDDGREVVYSKGSLIRAGSTGAFMFVDPPWLVDDDRIVLPLIVTREAENRTRVGGERTVLVTAVARSRSLATEFTTGDGHDATVTVTIESPYADAWGRFLDEEGWTAVDGDASDDEVVYERTTDALYVPRVRIDVDVT